MPLSRCTSDVAAPTIRLAASVFPSCSCSMHAWAGPGEQQDMGRGHGQGMGLGLVLTGKQQAVRAEGRGMNVLVASTRVAAVVSMASCPPPQAPHLLHSGALPRAVPGIFELSATPLSPNPYTCTCIAGAYNRM